MSKRYRMFNVCHIEALWLKSLAVSIKIDIDKPIIIYEDNNGCLSIANNPTNRIKLLE